MKRRLLFILLFICIAGAAFAEDAPQVLYFHKTLCENCDPAEEFAMRFAALTGQSLSDYRFSEYNVLHGSGARKLEEIAAEYGLEEPLLPLLIFDGKAYMGEEAISGALPADFLADAGSTDSVIYYLYVPACESCARVEAVLSALPETVGVTRGTYAFTSDVVIRRLDISKENGTALALFERYNVPDQDRVAPIVFLPGRYFAGAEKIEALLPAAIRSGMGVGIIAETEAQAMPEFTVPGAIAAGLTGGLNPCALSMLLLFLSLLIAGDGPAGRYAALFLGSKFVAYLLIGTVLLGVFQMFNPTWLVPITKVILTVISVLLILLNLKDAFAARREKYGDIRNQLPKGIRRYLHQKMQVSLAQKRVVGGGIVLLGVIVAGGEFLCAGQVYLALLLAALQTGAATLRIFGILMIYCAAFLLPSAILCFAVLRGKAAIAVSQWVLKRMAVIKVLTAVMLAAILAYTWLA